MRVDPEALPGTVYELFRRTARQYAGHPFLKIPASACAGYAGGDLDYSYAEAGAEVAPLLERYRAAGLGAGMRVAMLLANRPAFFFHWLALNALGVSVVPINPDYREAEAGYLLAHSEAVLAVALGERLPALLAAAKAAGLPIPVIDEASVKDGLPALRVPVAVRADPGRATECGLLYTSGTTGRPKGCMLSNDYYLRAAARHANRGGPVYMEPGKARVLTPLPLFHMNAMSGSTMAMLAVGGCIIQLDRFHPRTWWSDVAATRATGVHYLGVMPAILLRLPPAPEERAHCVRYGSGANVEPEHHAAFEARFGFPLLEGWAMTETGSGAAMGADEEPRHVGTRCFGRVPPWIELRLADDAGRDVPQGEAGEMLVRRAGPDPRLGFFSGYLKDDAATAAGWAGGWWHSGDLARQGPDGSLHFVDRKKNVIRRAGENVSALEVETMLLRHPSVAQVAVAAVDDELRGEEVMALVIPAAGCDTGAPAAQELARWAVGELAYFKAPGWIAFVDSLPTTATQKLERGALRAHAARVRESGACHDVRALKRRG